MPYLITKKEPTYNTNEDSKRFFRQSQEMSFVVSQLPTVPCEFTTVPNIILSSRLFVTDCNILADDRARVENLLCDYSESTCRIISTCSIDNHPIGKLGLCEPATSLVDTVKSVAINRIEISRGKIKENMINSGSVRSSQSVRVGLNYDQSSLNVLFEHNFVDKSELKRILIAQDCFNFCISAQASVRSIKSSWWHKS